MAEAGIHIKPAPSRPRNIVFFLIIDIFVFSLTLFFPKDSFENPRSIHLHTLETVEDAILFRAVAEVVVVPNESREASFASLRSQELTVVGHVFMHFL